MPGYLGPGSAAHHSVLRCARDDSRDTCEPYAIALPHVGKVKQVANLRVPKALILHARFHRILDVLDLLDLDVAQLAADLLDAPDVDGLHDVAGLGVVGDRSPRARQAHALGGWV